MNDIEALELPPTRGEPGMYVLLAISFGLYGWATGALVLAFTMLVHAAIKAMTTDFGYSAGLGAGVTIAMALPSLLLPAGIVILAVIAFRWLAPTLYINRGGLMAILAVIGAAAAWLIHYSPLSGYTFGANTLEYDPYRVPFLPPVLAGAVLGLAVAVGDRVARFRLDPDGDPDMLLDEDDAFDTI